MLAGRKQHVAQNDSGSIESSNKYCSCSGVGLPPWAIQKTDESPDWARFRSVWDDGALGYELMLIAMN